MPDAATTSTLRKCKVLLIEDERIIREIILRMLSKIGIADVTEASSAEAAWEYLVGSKRRSFHVVITDLTLPGASGGTLIKQLRKLPSPYTKTLPIIVLTGSTDLETYRKVATGGVSSYLMKPISADMLRAAIERAVMPGAPDVSAVG